MTGGFGSVDSGLRPHTNDVIDLHFIESIREYTSLI